jgi:hypothetical protein
MNTTSLWPLALYFAIMLLVSSIVGLSYLLGQRYKERAIGEPEADCLSPEQEVLRRAVK